MILWRKSNNEEQIMSYKDTLNNFDQADHLHEPETRTEEISQDIHQVLNDGSVFSELIANSVGEGLAKAIEKSGLDSLSSGAVDNMTSTLSEAVHNAINGEQFTHEIAQGLAQKEVDREMQNPHKQNKEMEV